MSLPPAWLEWIEGNGDEISTSITSDSLGNSYVTGLTNSTTAGIFTFAGTPYQKPATTGDAAFIGKVDSNGNALWLSMFDGSVNESGVYIDINSSGDLCVTGITNTTGGVINFITCTTSGSVSVPYNKPVTAADSVFVMKLNALTGSLSWLRLLDGTGTDSGLSISINTIGDICVTGSSDTTGTIINFITCTTNPVTPPLQINKPTTTTTYAFILKLTSSGSFTWLRLLDGITPLTGMEEGNSININDAGEICVTGPYEDTSATINFITCTTSGTSTQTYTKPVTSGTAGFIIKLDSSGTINLFKLIDVGADTVIPQSITFDSLGNVCVTGFSNSIAAVFNLTDILTVVTQPLVKPVTVSDSVFIMKLNSTGVIQWLRWLDGTGDEAASAITTDSLNNVYVTGISNTLGTAINFGFQNPFLPANSFPKPVTFNEATFIAKINSGGGLVWLQWLDGSQQDIGSGISVDSLNNVYITGTSNTPGTTITFAGQVFQKPTASNLIGFIGKLGVQSLPQLSAICYAKGTLIGTDRGFVPIEDIRLSDKVRTYDRIEERMFRPIHGVAYKSMVRVPDTRFKNRFANVKFIGNFSVNSMNEHTAPICITAGALGENKPERDLLVSPNHSMLIGDRLVLAKNLVNGRTIYQDMSFKKIEYYHILSDDHYLINANGTLSETLGTEELKLFETMIYAQSSVYEPLAFENKYHLQDIAA